MIGTPTDPRIAGETTTIANGRRFRRRLSGRGIETERGATSGGTVLALHRRIRSAGIRLLGARRLRRIRGRGGMMEGTMGGEEVPEEGLVMEIGGQWGFNWFFQQQCIRLV